MKFNMGCGYNKLDGYINVDKYPVAMPDIVHDLELTPWPIESNIAKYVIFNHSLEHMGQDPNVFLNIITELYRICDHEAYVQINVPHPRHDNFLGDPTHVRVITPMVMSLFSKANCDQWKISGASNTPFAHYLNVNFETIKIVQVLDPRLQDKFKSGLLSNDQITIISNESNNAIMETHITLKCIKSKINVG